MRNWYRLTKETERKKPVSKNKNKTEWYLEK